MRTRLRKPTTVGLGLALALAVAGCSVGGGAVSSSSRVTTVSSGAAIVIGTTLGKKYAGSPSYATAAVGYAVAEVLTDALTKAGSANPGRLNTAISRTSAQTTAGLVKFNQSTHTAATPFYITQWRNGQLIQVRPPAAGVTLDVPTAGLG